MPKVSEAHRESRQEQILDAAVACFLRRGIRATTMAEIISESGLSAGAIYSYFGSKQELAVAAVRREAAGRSAELDAAAQERAIPPSRILSTLSSSLEQRMAGLVLVVQLWGEAASDPEFREVSTSAFAELGVMFVSHLARWRQEQWQDEAPEAFAWAERMLPVLLGLAQGLILQQTLVSGFDPKGYLAGVDELFGAAS